MEKDVGVREVSHVCGNGHAEPVRHNLLLDLIKPRRDVYILLLEDQVPGAWYRAWVHHKLFAVETPRTAVISRDWPERDRLNVVLRCMAERARSRTRSGRVP